MNKKLILLCLFCNLIISLLHSQNVDIVNVGDTTIPQVETRPKIGLVLSGGGAKGAAHIGVLKVIEELQIPIDYIVGTSMGSIMAGLYSIGYHADELDTLISNLDWSYVLSNSTSWEKNTYNNRRLQEKYFVTIPFKGFINPDFQGREEVKRDYTILDDVPSGFINGQNVKDLFISLSVGYHGDINFDSLPIPFASVVADLVDGKEYVIRSGSLPEAIRTSMSIPGVFSPVYKDGKVLVDGGLANNYPVDVAKAMGADIIIGVDVGQSLVSSDRLNNLYGVMMQVVELLKFNKLDINRYNTDVYIAPETENFTSLSFSKESIRTLIENGYQAALQNRDYLEALRAMLDSCGYNPKIDTLNFEKAKNLDQDSFYITDIQYNGLSNVEQDILKLKLNVKQNTKVSGADIKDDVSMLYAMSLFSDVNYTLQKNGNTYKLIYDFERSPLHSLSVGAKFDLEEYAQLLLKLTYNRFKLYGPKASVAMSLDINPSITVNYAYIFRKVSQLNITDKIKGNNFKFFGANSNLRDIAFNNNILQISWSAFSFKSGNVVVGTEMENFFIKSFSPQQYLPDGSFSMTDNNYLNVFLNTELNTMNTNDMDASGVLGKLRAKYYFVGSGSKFEPFCDLQFSLEGTIDIGEKTKIIPRIAQRTLISESIPALYNNMFGGMQDGRYMEHQMAFEGLNYADFAYKNLVIGRLTVQHRIFNRQYLSLIANYAVTCDDYDFYHSKDAFGIGLGYTYFLPFVGPATLHLHWSNISKSLGLSFSIGYFF